MPTRTGSGLRLLNNRAMSEFISIPKFSKRRRIGPTVGEVLADPMADFWHGGNGPSHSVIDRKLSSLGLEVDAGSSKEQKVYDAFVEADTETAIELLEKLLDTLRQFSKWDLGNTKGDNLREAMARVGLHLTDDFYVKDAPSVERMEERLTENLGDIAVPASITATDEQLTELRKAPIGPATPTDIFLVHGHDERNLYKIERLVRRLTGVEPTILNDQVNQGQTLIEKFESNAQPAAYAIVLMTPDDVGRAKRTPENRPGGVGPDLALDERARENVVFELGYFYGKLGRKNVCVLDFGISQPGDIKGVVYIANDNELQLKLAGELKAAGFKISI